MTVARIVIYLVLSAANQTFFAVMCLASFRRIRIIRGARAVAGSSRPVSMVFLAICMSASCIASEAKRGYFASRNATLSWYPSLDADEPRAIADSRDRHVRRVSTAEDELGHTPSYTD